MLAEQRAKLFTFYASNTYYRNVDYHVDSVKQDGVPLEVAASEAVLSSGTYFYSYNERKLYVNAVGDGDPINENISIVYRFHFSSAPLILPYDLDDGYEVEWLPYIDAIGNIGQSLDDENVGIVLESSSSVSLINQGFFDNIFDTLLFENKAVSFYHWFPITNITESRKIFEGVIESISYATDKVVFNVKDFTISPTVITIFPS